MKNMLFLILLFALPLLAQDTHSPFQNNNKDSLTTSIVSTFSPASVFKYVDLFLDASSIGNDSVKIEIYSKGLGDYHITGARQTTTDSLFNTITLLTSSKVIYRVNNPRPWKLKATLLNYGASNPTRKVYLEWRPSND
jgi:hypothetical protein